VSTAQSNKTFSITFTASHINHSQCHHICLCIVVAAHSVANRPFFTTVLHKTLNHQISTSSSTFLTMPHNAGTLHDGISYRSLAVTTAHIKSASYLTICLMTRGVLLIPHAASTLLPFLFSSTIIRH